MMVYFGDHASTGFGLPGLPLFSLSALLGRQALSLRGKHYGVLDCLTNLLFQPCSHVNEQLQLISLSKVKPGWLSSPPARCYHRRSSERAGRHPKMVEF
ncbi:hypothetical protein E2C01_001465 [Portunus trituberculatus]|uniref:Uncharacterized protein n=1 Tax=Portunus trituberculatus TaxID=210409 RepID=A0A5B7CHP8_PORTR|nr:hypothetical protein [Portunus trituberculatus]